jgi:hypothetical protein
MSTTDAGEFGFYRMRRLGLIDNALDRNCIRDKRLIGSNGSLPTISPRKTAKPNPGTRGRGVPSRVPVCVYSFIADQD